VKLATVPSTLPCPTAAAPRPKRHHDYDLGALQVRSAVGATVAEDLPVQTESPVESSQRTTAPTPAAVAEMEEALDQSAPKTVIESDAAPGSEPADAGAPSAESGMQPSAADLALAAEAPGAGDAAATGKEGADGTDEADQVVASTQTAAALRLGPAPTLPQPLADQLWVESNVELRRNGTDVLSQQFSAIHALNQVRPERQLDASAGSALLTKALHDLLLAMRLQSMS